MKELTKTYGNLLQDKRVRSEQAKYENFTRQRGAVLTKYRRVFQAFNDLIDGLMRAQAFYSEMKDTVESLEKNVETFVNNRRSEGAQLLAQIERDKQANAGNQADRERDRLKDLMERMSMSPTGSTSPSRSQNGRPNLPSRPSDAPSYKSPPTSPPYQPAPSVYASYSQPKPITDTYPSSIPREFYQPQQPGANASAEPYNPMSYSYKAPVSPPPQNQFRYSGQNVPEGYVMPPPPPGPPPNAQGLYAQAPFHHHTGSGSYSQPPNPQRHSNTTGPQSQADPWAGLNAWK